MSGTYNQLITGTAFLVHGTQISTFADHIATSGTASATGVTITKLPCFFEYQQFVGVPQGVSNYYAVTFSVGTVTYNTLNMYGSSSSTVGDRFLISTTAYYVFRFFM